MAKESAYLKGYNDAITGQKQKTGRAYETDKANNAYFRGFADGLRQQYPGQMIVQCNRDSTIFPAFPNDMGSGEYIECPTCFRRYFKKDNEYVSDRALTIL